jgi:putative transposase
MVFLTLVTGRRRPLFAEEPARQLLRQAIAQTMTDRPWEMTAVVLLPDHLHMIWRLPDGDVDYSTRVSLLKKRFTRAFLAAGGEETAAPAGQRRHRLRGVWQRRFWEHTIRSAKDFRMHVDYIHLNPVKHGLAARPADWPWSSFHRYVRQGWYEEDWCGTCDLPASVEYLWPE